ASAAGEHHRRVDEGADAHEHDDRVVGPAADLGQLVVAGRDRVGGRDTAVGQRDAGDGGNRVRARDSGHDLHLDSGLPAVEDLLSPASEDEGVPTLEADDAATAAGLFDEDVVDPRLRDRVMARCLPTSMISASKGRPRSVSSWSMTDLAPRRSATMTSADSRPRRPVTVSIPRSPGPA